MNEPKNKSASEQNGHIWFCKPRLEEAANFAYSLGPNADFLVHIFLMSLQAVSRFGSLEVSK
jgi:hypothetical protein